MRQALLVLALVTTAQAQWTLQPSGTTASLRGIHAVSAQIAWASGTSGTVLHTTDGGAHWLPCATPPQADHLDFRGIQAFDAQTAIVMSSGKGDLSRLYKTTDACQTWTLLFTNPDKEGFWDALQVNFREQPSGTGLLIGDPVDREFAIFTSDNNGDSWSRWGIPGSGWKGPCGERKPRAAKQDALFAASNQSALLASSFHRTFVFVTGGKAGARVISTDYSEWDGPPCATSFDSLALPLGNPSESSGAFAAAIDKWDGWLPGKLMVVGGDYKQPDKPARTFLLVQKTGLRIPFTSYFAVPIPSQTPPHGYRSAVAYNPTQNSWITVGPNGTDLSTDDGRNWHPLKPSPTDAPDADRNWNALSLPFAVGPEAASAAFTPPLRATTPGASGSGAGPTASDPGEYPLHPSMTLPPPARPTTTICSPSHKLLN